MRDAEYKSQGLAVANTGESNIGMRRASGLYELYEQVLKKEVDLEQRPTPMLGSGPESDTGTGFTVGRKKGKGKAKAKKAKVSEVAEHVRTEAEMQLRESGPFGQVESKWTWGVDLNSRDIWLMARGADKNYQIPHSGYDDDLRTGKLRSSSPIPSPNDIEDLDDPDIIFDELTHNPFIRDLRPDKIPLAFSFPTLHYRAVGNSDSGLELPPASGSDKSDSHPIIPEGSRPHRPRLDSPPHGYMHPRPDLVSMRNPGSLRGARFDLERISEPDNVSELDPFSDPERSRLSRNLNSDTIMDVYISSGSDDETTESRMRANSAENSSTGLYGLVMPDLPDDSDEDINIGDLGRDTVELSMRAEDIQIGTYGLVRPDSSDKEIAVEDFGLVAPDMQSDSGDEVEVGNLGLNSVDQVMWAETVVDESDDDSRARVWVRITLPRVNPATGQYTADSFSNVPNEWLD